MRIHFMRCYIYMAVNTNKCIYYAMRALGFHEAIGDVLALSVSTPSHLAKIGLMKNGSNSRGKREPRSEQHLKLLN